MSTADTAIRVSNLSKCYQIYDSPRDRLKQFVLPGLQRPGRANAQRPLALPQAPRAARLPNP